MNTNTIQLRRTLIALLDDENGINSEGYEHLQSLAISIGEGNTGDIFNAVESSENRYYLPEDHGILAEMVEHTPDSDKTISNSGHHFINCGGTPRCSKCGCDEDAAFVGGEECKSQ
jgi:hypothetical protein